MVFAEGIFEGETHVLHPKESEVTSRLDVALYPPRDVPVDIHIKVEIFNHVRFYLACVAPITVIFCHMYRDKLVSH
jgi:Bardet-Biedl syndrome 2 protein